MQSNTYLVILRHKKAVCDRLKVTDSHASLIITQKARTILSFTIGVQQDGP